MLQQQHHRAKSIGIDNLVKNIMNSKQKVKSVDDDSTSADLQKLMSAMNDSEYEQGQANTAAASKSIGSPSSPSSLSSASSTTSNHSSSSSNQHQQHALQAAVQALMHQQQTGAHHNGLLTQEKPNNMQAIQQQQQINQLLASIAAAQQHQNSQQSNVLLNNLLQQQLEGGAKKAGTQKLNVKTKGANSRSLKGNSVSPPGTGSSCSDDQEAHSPSDSDLVKSEPNYDVTQAMESNSDDLQFKNQRKKSLKTEFPKPIEDGNDYENDLDRSTNSSIAENSQNPDQELEDELDDYETSFSRDPKRHRNHSTSSPTRSTSSRSTSPSTTSYHDSSAAFPSLNPLDSATAMLGGLNCTAPNGMNSFLDISTESGKKRRTLNGDLSVSERNKKIKPVPADKKDDAYWERRRKNNEAAKRSRDLRRQKEDEIAVKATVLEQENLKLKAQVTILKAELSKLHFMLYNR